MSTFKSTNRKNNFSNPFGSLVDPSVHIRTNKQTKLLYNIDDLKNNNRATVWYIF